MKIAWQELIDKYYPVHRKVRGILLSHSRAVADMAMQINREKELGLDEDTLEAAAMLHDIGIIETDAPGIDCFGNAPYLCHGAIGADMIRSVGLPEEIARVAERHTGAGLTAEEIEMAKLPLSQGRCYMPETTLEKLVCYSDCFYSKGSDMGRKSLERVEKSMARFGEGVLSRFKELHQLFY